MSRLPVVFRVLPLVLVLLVFGATVQSSDHHYLCRVEFTGDTVKLLDATRIEAPLPMLRAQNTRAALRLNAYYNGELLYRRYHADPRLLRGVYLDANGETQHVAKLRDKGVMLVRLPALPTGARLTVELKQAAEGGEKQAVRYAPVAETMLDLAGLAKGVRP